jgi:two-component system cell cycle response regulator
MKVLVADDESTARLVLSQTLSRFGHDVRVARDGREAWEQLKGPEGVQIAVLDWQMPELSGIELCRRVREQKLGPYVYVILVTARSRSEDVVEGLSAGADDFIFKPVEPKELGARLRTAERIVELQTQSERARSYLTAILATIDVGVLLADAQGQVVYANEVLANMSGVSTADTIHAARDRFPWTQWNSASRSGQFPSPASDGVRSVRDFEAATPPRRLRQTSATVLLPDGVGTLDVYRDITAEVDHARQIAHMATTDSLTGLCNRRGAEDCIQREVARSRRMGMPLSFVLFDIDHFKNINDNFGHAVGDTVIQQVAQVLKQNVRITDVAARWGGEEFLLVLSATGGEGAKVLAERVRIGVADCRLPHVPPVSVCAGVSELEAGGNFTDALRRADECLYLAKRSGRNRVC